MRDALLDDEQRAALLPSLPAWTASESELTRTVSAALVMATCTGMNPVY